MIKASAMEWQTIEKQVMVTKRDFLLSGDWIAGGGRRRGDGSGRSSTR